MTRSRYKVIRGEQVIQIQVDSADEILDSKDPAPFKGQILDDDFLDYIESLSDETSHKTPLRINIVIEKQLPHQTPTNSAIISQALKEHFEYKIERKKGEIRKYLRTARLFLIMGLVLLSICLMIAHTLLRSEESLLRSALREGVIIFGWVSMWRPLEIMMFDWYPHYDRIRYFRKISNAQVHIEYHSKPS